MVGPKQPRSLPTREEIEQQFEDLLAKRRSREEIASWAASFWTIDDWRAWDALTKLMGADLRDFDNEYFHGESQIRGWLEELRTSSKEE
jgi:hypothetical protein